MTDQFNGLRKQLKQYFEHIYLEGDYSDNQIDNFIDLCSLSFILQDSIRIKKNQLESIGRKIIQLHKNKLMKSEIQRLSKSANNKNIKTVLLKGIILKDKYYSNQIMRLTTDIDLFVSMEDLTSFMIICKENGYLFESGKEINIQHIEKYISTSRIEKYHHIDPIVKEFNETDINPPAELGRLAGASGDKQSTRI